MLDPSLVWETTDGHEREPTRAGRVEVSEDRLTIEASYDTGDTSCWRRGRVELRPVDASGDAYELVIELDVIATPDQECTMIGLTRHVAVALPEPLAPGVTVEGFSPYED